MSQTFKCKNNKVKKKDIRVTLDVKHEEKKKYFLKQKESLKDKELLLLSLNKRLNDKLTYGLNNLNNKDFNVYLEVKDNISELENEIESLKNNKEEIDYLLNTGQLVFQYYENINKIALGENINYNLKDSKNKINVVSDISNTCKKKKVIDFFNSGKFNLRLSQDAQTKDSLNDVNETNDSSLNNIDNNLNNESKEECDLDNNQHKIKDDNDYNSLDDQEDELKEGKDNLSTEINKIKVKDFEKEDDESKINNDEFKINNNNLLGNLNDSEVVKQTESRIKILNKYLSIVDNKLIDQDENSEDDNYICQKCNKEKFVLPNEAILICKNCGEISYILLDSEKPSYKDPPKEISYFAYKRINHFNEWLAQFQAKESTDIPESVYDQILMEIKKERIENMANLKPQKLRILLKKLKLNKYYEHVPHIMNRLNGIPAPVMTRDTEEILRSMFREIQNPFIKYCPKDRKNFLSYSYVLHKFVQLLNMDEFLVCFPLLKSREKLHQQDIIWKQICDDLNWEFIKSL